MDHVACIHACAGHREDTNAHAPAFKMLPSIWREKRETEGRASTI